MNMKRKVRLPEALSELEKRISDGTIRNLTEGAVLVEVALRSGAGLGFNREYRSDFANLYIENLFQHLHDDSWIRNCASPEELYEFFLDDLVVDEKIREVAKSCEKRDICRRATMLVDGVSRYSLPTSRTRVVPFHVYMTIGDYIETSYPEPIFLGNERYKNGSPFTQSLMEYSLLLSSINAVIKRFSKGVLADWRNDSREPAGRIEVDPKVFQFLHKATN